MSMEINEKYGRYPIDYARRLDEEREKVQETKKEQSGEKDLRDEYISSEKSGAKPSGLYRLGQDENGREKIYFDDPRKAGKAGANGNPKAEPAYSDQNKDDKQPKVNADNPEESAKKCTANTDRVDREIEKLKEKQQQLEQQIKSASGDEEKVKELEKKLAQVESELSQKDNDTYRRQNAMIS